MISVKEVLVLGQSDFLKVGYCSFWSEEGEIFLNSNGEATFSVRCTYNSLLFLYLQ